MKSNEYYAKRFGWKRKNKKKTEKGEMGGGWISPDGRWYWYHALPDFTGSVDIMIAEVGRQGLHLRLYTGEQVWVGTIFKFDPGELHRHGEGKASVVQGDTPAEALAQALDAYIGENDE